MSPRRGGSYSFGGSSSSSCDHCSDPILLSGSNFQDTQTTARFVLTLLFLIALLAELVGSCLSKWSFKGRVDIIRGWGVPLSILGAILYFILQAVDIAVSEVGATVTNLWNLIYIFDNLGWRGSELLLLLIIPRIVCEQITVRTGSKGMANAIEYTSYGVFVLLSVICIAGYGLYINYIATQLANGYADGTYVNRSIKVDVAYHVMSLIFSLSLLVLAAVRLHSKAVVKGVRTCVLILLFVWFFREIWQVVSVGVAASSLDAGSYDAETAQTYADVQDASYYFYGLCNIGIYGLIVFLGLRSKRTMIPGKNGNTAPASTVYNAGAAWPAQDAYPPHQSSQPNQTQMEDASASRYYYQPQQQQAYAQPYYTSAQQPGSGYASPPQFATSAPPVQYQAYNPEVKNSTPVAYQYPAQTTSPEPQYPQYQAPQ